MVYLNKNDSTLRLWRVHTMHALSVPFKLKFLGNVVIFLILSLSEFSVECDFLWVNFICFLFLLRLFISNEFPIDDILCFYRFFVLKFETQPVKSWNRAYNKWKKKKEKKNHSTRPDGFFHVLISLALPLRFIWIIVSYLEFENSDANRSFK